jgi:hypothetical protein
VVTRVALPGKEQVAAVHVAGIVQRSLLLFDAAAKRIRSCAAPM